MTTGGRERYTRESGITKLENALLSLPALKAANYIKWRLYRETYEATPKLCRHCSTPIPYIKRRDFYCNQSCAARFSNVGRARNGKLHPYLGKVRLCDYCNKKTRGYTVRFCSVRCQAELAYQSYIDRWLAGEEDGLSGVSATSKYVRRFMFEKYDHKCSECGWNRTNQFTGRIPLQVHHKDGNYANTVEENLDLLCLNCHSLTKNFGGSNRGNGRPDRRERRRKRQSFG